MMPDPWKTFAAKADASEVCGYFERGPARGSMATWFLEADDVLIPRDSQSVGDLEADSATLLRHGEDSMLLGYVGFEASGVFEPLLKTRRTSGPFPLGELALVRRARWVPVRPRRRTHPGSRVLARFDPLDDTLPRRSFERSVRRLKRAIHDGEAYQVVLSHRREWHRPDELVERATALRDAERFAFFFYLRFGTRVLVGASPETVVEVKDGRATIDPIAGTRPIGESWSRRRPLREDRKELAEHRMLVDLARNDLGQISKIGSVRVAARERRERYARVEHLVSRVSGELRPGLGAWTTLASAFPAGTVSGAPKIRATQLVRTEERSWRGPYAGAVGFLDARGQSQWALAIRTAFAAGSRLYTAAGAGIVSGSQPPREYHETIAKLAQVETSLVGGM